MAETFLQRGRLLLQVDRSGVRRQLSALGQRSSLTSPVRVLAGLLGPPTRCLASFLRDATNLGNGLLSQVAKALQGLGLIIPTHGCPAMLNKPVDRRVRSPKHGRSQPLPPTGPSPRRGAEVAGIGVWLVLPRGRSTHDGAEGGQARPEVGAA